jgi:hypothetical protein
MHATSSGWLEPAASIGGDTFHYSLGRDVLHLSVTDAMGHGVASALTATLCVGSLRNTRRMETTRRLTDQILETCGPTLADDATLLVLDWEGGHGRDAPPSPAPAPPAQAPQAPRPSG